MKKLLKLLLIPLVIALPACSKSRTIDFSKEITVSISGQEGNSQVIIAPKKGGVIEELKESADVEIQRLNKGEPLSPELDKLHAISAGYFYTCCTDANLSELHNGDVITYSCQVNPNIKEEYHIEEVNVTFDTEVTGLE